VNQAAFDSETPPRTPLSVRLIRGNADSEQWDRYVADTNASTFCHQSGWKQIMEDVLGHECLYFAAVDGSGEWRGVLPLVRVRSVLGHYLISLPFLNDGGPLGDAESQQSLVEYAIAEAKRSGASLLELRSREDVPGPLTPSYRRVSVHLSLPSSREELWENTLRPKLRSQIRRPGKEGMTFRAGAAELDGFYAVFARNMRDLGTPVLPRKFFELGASSFATSMIFAAIYSSAGVPVAGACCLHWRDELEVTWASSLREYNRLSPNMLLYASLMEEAIDRGVKIFNFGRSEAGGSTHKFKQQWGGHDVPLPWPFWSPSAVVRVPSAKNPFYRVATAVWSQLPVTITNRLGPVLARLLP
jgi:serine/alanine adding enzyme